MAADDCHLAFDAGGVLFRRPKSVGSALCGGPQNQESSVRIGVLLPNWVGDVAMATPALRTLRKHLPKARLIGIARPYLISLLEGTPWLDANIPWEHKGRGRLGRTWRLVKQLRSEQLDLLITLRASLSAGIVGRLSGAKQTIGYARRGLGWLLTDPVEPLHRGRGSQPVSAVDGYLNTLDTP